MKRQIIYMGGAHRQADYSPNKYRCAQLNVLEGTVLTVYVHGFFQVSEGAGGESEPVAICEMVDGTILYASPTEIKFRGV